MRRFLLRLARLRLSRLVPWGLEAAGVGAFAAWLAIEWGWLWLVAVAGYLVLLALALRAGGET